MKAVRLTALLVILYASGITAQEKAILRDPLPTIAKLQAFLNEVLASPWTRGHFGTRLLAEPIIVWPGTEDHAEASSHWGYSMPLIVTLPWHHRPRSL